ncbi:MAG: hypothetical protein FWF70_08345 [Bacteroidetes bacterium]|nr:hypothetical protein [Bacteroidota bacterium]MCL1968262.1 hypothetical protein [Bacteroidota bacterium]
METEKIIFIVLALVFSVFSMVLKSKKQKRSFPEKESADTDFSISSEIFSPFYSEPLFKQSDTEHLQENFNIYSKNVKKKLKIQNFEKNNSEIENSKKNSQNIDLENEIILLEDIECTELQKAFLYSEIFKNPIN